MFLDSLVLHWIHRGAIVRSHVFLRPHEPDMPFARTRWTRGEDRRLAVHATMRVLMTMTTRRT
ncbi:hypothetical protein BDV97DRAFT_342574 [Delphinella strobiligena]|nr:hypothetical protein BDV97DRAFT_342574 [Delphinella strobiligena]